MSLGRSLGISFFAIVGLVGADPMPYDSIANPLDRLPSSNSRIQWLGDSLNMSPNRVRVNQAGYRQMDVAAGYAKFYCVGCTGSTFSVINAQGVAAGSGSLTPKGVTVSGKVTAYASNSAEHAHNGEGDWKTGYPMTGKVVSGALTQGILPATLPAGRYTIHVGVDTSVSFIVSDNVYGMARDAAIKFFGVARSGDYESWFHAPSHMWDGWLYDTAARNPDGTYKYKGALKGGWYDCGNHLKEARTNSYPLAALGMLAATMPEKDADRYALNQNTTATTDRIPDVMREAWVGAQFVLNSWRLAKGKPADMILSVGQMGFDFNWWGRPENQDAVLSVTRGGRNERKLLKNWGSASMSDFAAGLAFLSRMYRPYDPAFADTAKAVAIAMYEGAKAANRDDAMPDYTADNTAFDDLGLAAVALLWATGDTKYLNEAVHTKALPDGKGGTCKSTLMTPEKAERLFDGGYFACDPDDGMKKKGGPTDYTTAQSFALYAFTKLILVNSDTAAHYGVTPAQRDTFLLRSINQMAGPLWGSSAGPVIQIPTGDQYNPTRLSYDSIWYSMGIGYGKSGWWNKYQFGNLADLYLFYDMTSLVDGRTILDKPGNTDWKRKEVLQVLLGGLNYMFGTNALDLSYLYGIGRKNPMHPHHRAANPEGKNVPGAYYNYTIPVGGLYGGILTGPSNTEALVEKFGDPVGQTEANCPDAQAAVLIPLMGLSKENIVLPPKATVKVLYTTDTMAMIQVDLDKWGSLKLGYGLDSTSASQTKIVVDPDTGGTFKIRINGLSPATQYYFHVVATDLQGLTSTSGKWPNGASDSIPYSFTTKAQPAVPPQFGNIKVCNVTSDSAEIMWYTPNGEYQSSVKWADSTNWKIAKVSFADTDAAGDIPVKFHRVKLYGLKAKTTYNFQVGIPGSYDAAVGCFRTPGEDVKFDIRATHYTWDGHPAMGIGIINQDVKSYDSLQIRLYVNGTRAEILDLAARVDIAFAYRADGFADSGLFSYTKNVQRSRPQLIDPSCSATSSCAWYFDLPMGGAVMETQARWRLDVVFDRHNLIRDSTEILNMAPTHDPFAVGSQDWSMRAHVAGADGGLSPVDFSGVPLMSKNAIDSATMDIPVDPYIAVYRRNEFVYGFSPFAGEQATKRTVYAMNAVFEKPFDVSYGNTVQMTSTTSTRLKGVLDPYDQMMPTQKGYITAIWMNGVALSDAERKAALTRQQDGTWKVDLPVRLVSGTNKVDVTFFAGSDSTESVSTGGCDEGKGCAFLDAHWYVNFSSNMTQSVLAVVDVSDDPLVAVTPDSSMLRIRVKDFNANLSKTAVDAVVAKVFNTRTGLTISVSLLETGVATGVFQTDLMKAVSTIPSTGQLQTMPGDSLVVYYVDANDPGDSSGAVVRAKSQWPSPVRGGIFRNCGGTFYAKVQFDRAFPATAVLGADTVVLRMPAGDTLSLSVSGAATSLDASRTLLTIPLALVADNPSRTGRAIVSVPDGAGGFRRVLQALSDSVGPWIDSTKIVENVSGSPVDTLFVWTAEAAKPLGKSLPVVLTRGGIAVSTALLTVDSSWLSDPVTGRWTFAVRGGVVKAHDSLRWSPAVVADLHGNSAENCPNLLREVKLMSRPAPFQRAWIKDADGDGRADQVVLLYKKPPLAKELPDSIGVAFGLADSMRNVKVAASMLTDSVLTVPLTSPFPISETRGSSPDGSGGMNLWKDGTADGPYALADSVGPALLSAKLVYGRAATDTLKLVFSEPVDSAAGAAWMQIKKSVATNLVFRGAPVSETPLVWKVAFDTGLVVPGDSVRPQSGGRFVDRTGRSAALFHPWVVVTGDDRPPAYAWYSDVNGDGKVDQVTLKWARAPRTRPAFQLRWPSISGGYDTVRVPADSWKLQPDGLTAVMAISGFDSLVTSSWNTDLGLQISGSTRSPFPIYDSVGPVLVSARLAYGTGRYDTLVVVFTEPIGPTTGSTGLASAASPLSSITYVGLPTTPDALLWRIPVDTGTVLPGDSIRPISVAGFIDGSINHPSSLHPWVVVSGVERPPRDAWYTDLDGDGAVDHVTVQWGIGPRTHPDLTFLWPNAKGTMDSISVASGAWSLGLDGRTATIAVGPFEKGVTTAATTDLGRQNSGGTITSFPIRDSVGPVLTRAHLTYGLSSADTLTVTFSEPVSASALATGLAKPGSPLSSIAFVGAASTLDGLVWTIPVDTGSVFPGDSIIPVHVAGFFDAFGNHPSNLHPWVVVSGTERPPRSAWYSDVDGDGAVDHVAVQWGSGPRTRPGLTFLWPSAVGGMDSVSVAAGTWSLGLDGRTAVFAIGPFDVGVTSSPTVELGRQNSGGTITSFPISDRVAPVMLKARLGYAQIEGVPDTLHLVWSEPIRWNGGEPLVVLRSVGSVKPVQGQLTVLRADSLGGDILLNPVDSLQTGFRAGDVVRLAPASAGTLTDRFGNVAEDPSRWVPVVLGRRPPRFQVVFDPNKMKYKDWAIEPGPALQIWVKSATDQTWTDFSTGEAVPALKVSQGMGPVISLNQPLRGQGYIYDKQGTYVAHIDLRALADAFYTDRVPKDGSNQYQVRIQWNGTAANGKVAGSGVYVLRLVLYQNTAAENEQPEWMVVNKLYPFGWEIKAK